MGHGFGLQPSFSVGIGGDPGAQDRAEQRRRQRAKDLADQGVANVLAQQYGRMSQPLPSDTTFTKLDVGESGTGVPFTSPPAGDFRFPEAQSYQSGPTQSEAIQALRSMNLPPDAYAMAVNRLVGRLPQEPEAPGSAKAKEQATLGQRIAGQTATPADVARAETSGMRVSGYDPQAREKKAFLAEQERSGALNTAQGRAGSVDKAIAKGWRDVAQDIQTGGAVRKEARQETAETEALKQGNAEADQRQAEVAALKQRGVRLTPEDDISINTAIGQLRSGDPKEISKARGFFESFGAKMASRGQAEQRISVAQRRLQLYERRINEVKAEKDSNKKQAKFYQTMNEIRRQVNDLNKEKLTADPIRRGEIDDQISNLRGLQEELGTHMREWAYGQPVEAPPGGSSPAREPAPAGGGTLDPSLSKYLNK